MKRISNLISTSAKGLTIAALIAGVAFVQPVAAADCTAINTIANNGTSAINTKLGAMSSDFTGRLTTITTNLDVVDKKITEARATAATNFDTKISDLKSTQDISDTQLAAIEQYKTDMLAAEKTRETAVDAARATYRAGLVDAVKSYQDSLTGSANTFKSTAASYFQWAKDQCAADKNQTTIRTWLKGYIATTKSTFAGARGTDTTKAKISELAQTRNQAIADANKAFTDAATGYAATLATALNAVQNTAPTDTTQDTAPVVDESTDGTTGP